MAATGPRLGKDDAAGIKLEIVGDEGLKTLAGSLGLKLDPAPELEKGKPKTRTRG